MILYTNRNVSIQKYKNQQQIKRYNCIQYFIITPNKMIYLNIFGLIVRIKLLTKGHIKTHIIYININNWN
jgi:hypothetical protein